MIRKISRIKILILLSLFSFINANDSNSLFMATAALNAGMYEEALMHINKAKMDDPTSSKVYQMKALLHEALDQPKKALVSWNNCLRYSKSKKVKKQAKNHISILSEDQ